MTETPSSNPISPRLHRIAEMAREHPERAFTNLAHHIDVDWLREAFRQTRKSGAVGVDGVTAEEYRADLERNLQGLLGRFKSGTYRAPAVRRVHIPKGDGRMRPLGIPSFEDKVLQRAVAMLLNAIYEQDFMDCSYGFRPRRSAHQALDRLWKATMNGGGGWVLEADIRDCFGTLVHDWMRKILSRRIRDGVLLRQINKWLKVGILEDGCLQRPTSGTPQGGVISPVLANVYLHEVLDLWFAECVQPRLLGRAELIRYADDFVIVFEHESDARRVYEVLPKRFAAHGLELHPEKTKLIPFRRPGGPSVPESFDFLGFTHFWSRSRKGHWVVKQKTMAKRLRRSLKRVDAWCRAKLHSPVAYQHDYLNRILRGHCQYYGITGNSRCLQQFRHGMQEIWRKWLLRRSNSARRAGYWDRWNALCVRYPLGPAHAVRSNLRYA